MYDSTKEETMKTAATLLQVITSVRGAENPLEVVLVGTKVDLYTGTNEGDIYRVVDTHLNVKADWIYNHQLISSKDDVNVGRAMELVLEKVLRSTPSDQLTVERFEPSMVFCCGISCCNKHSN